jgi:hypothetical protein
MTSTPAAVRTSAADQTPTHRSTVALAMPNCRATLRRGTPSGTSRLINAQSSIEITHPISLGGLVSTVAMAYFERRRHEPRDVAASWRLAG